MTEILAAESAAKSAWAIVKPVAVVVAIAAAWHFTPMIGPHARLARAAALQATTAKARDDWRTASGAWMAAYRASAALRGREARTAVAAVSADASACAARVAEARRSASAIQSILTTEPSYDPSTHCPVRQLVPAGRLRDALRLGPAPAG